MLKFYDQTTFSDSKAGTHGDCFRACVCTMIQLDPSELPHPIAPDGGWNTKIFGALRDRGLAVRTMGVTAETMLMKVLVDLHWGAFEVPQIVMAAGMSPRGVRHSIIWNRTTRSMVHDPHPSRAGLVEIDAFDYVAPFPPPKFKSELCEEEA